MITLTLLSFVWFFLIRRTVYKKKSHANLNLKGNYAAAFSGILINKYIQVNIIAMKNKENIFSLIVDDPLLSSRFYTNYLGFKRIKYKKKISLRHPLIKSCKIELYNSEKYQQAGEKLVFPVKNNKIKLLYNSYKEKHRLSNISFIETTIHGFEVKDCNDNILCFQVN